MRFKRMVGELALALLVGFFAQCCIAGAIEADELAAPASGGHQPQATGRNFVIVNIPNGALNIFGILFKPPGKGPFRAIVYNHGSEQTVANIHYSIVGNFYSRNGYVCLIPLRRGHSYSANLQVQCTSEGQLFNDRVDRDAQSNPSQKNQFWVKEQDVDNEDVEAAVEWLKKQSFVDPNDMIMSGISFGGIQTCLAAEKGMGIRAFVPFAPGAMSWNGVPELRERLKKALENAKAPVFLIQAENDFNLGPSNYLGAVLDRKGPPNRHKIYPPFQTERGHAGGHGGFALQGESIWAKDVSDFLQQATGRGL
jgi:dienelactone hydrolase